MNALKNLPIGLKVVAALVAAEGLVLGYFAVQLGIGIIAGESRAFVTALALFGMVAGATAWVLFVAYSLTRGKRWARSAALFWQLVQLAIATGSFTGQFGSLWIGWSIAAPSAAVLMLLFSKKVVAATLAGLDPEED